MQICYASWQTTDKNPPKLHFISLLRAQSYSPNISVTPTKIRASFVLPRLPVDSLDIAIYLCEFENAEHQTWQLQTMAVVGTTPPLEYLDNFCVSQSCLPIKNALSLPAVQMLHVHSRQCSCPKPIAASSLPPVNGTVHLNGIIYMNTVIA